MANNMKKLLTTLCIVHQHPKVLLGMKKRGFGQGRWNGFGGKVQDGEEIKTAAKRELSEEASINVEEIERIGVLDFEWRDKPEIIQVHIFEAKNFEGEPIESEEMKPQWFHVNEIPFEEMWPDDKHWFPLFLDGKKFKGRFLFDQADNILDYELSEVKKQTG